MLPSTFLEINLNNLINLFVSFCLRTGSGKTSLCASLQKKKARFAKDLDLEETKFMARYVIQLSALSGDELLDKIDNPHLKLPPCIHISGTNGKGSTLNFIKSIMLESNYKIHAYISPHLEKINERYI